MRTAASNDGGLGGGGEVKVVADVAVLVVLVVVVVVVVVVVGRRCRWWLPTDGAALCHASGGGRGGVRLRHSWGHHITLKAFKFVVIRDDNEVGSGGGADLPSVRHDSSVRGR